MARRALWSLCILGVLALTPGLALAQAGANKPRGPIEVGVIAMEPGNVPYVRTLPGRAVAFERTDIRPRVGGAIVEILYRPGVMLALGDPMFRIEDATYRAALSAAQATVAGARAELATARAAAERYRALQGRAATATDLQNAELSVAKAEAALSAAEAAQETASINLSHTTINSPIAGIAAAPDVTVGALVTANQATALTTVTRLDPIYVDVSDSSVGMLRIRDRVAAGELQPGDRVGLRLLLETGIPYSREGELVTMGTEVQSSTGTVDQRIRFDNPDRLILPGQFLRVEVTLGTMRAILVPQRATSRGLDGSLTAWVVREGAARRATLDTSGTYRNAWITTAGIEAGDVLIVDGTSNLFDGAEVKTLPVNIDTLGVVRELPRTAGTPSAPGN